MKTERPILMSTDMVVETREGRKTNTRRQLTKMFDNDNQCPSNVPLTNRWYYDDMNGSTYFNCRYGKKGDILWVRESCIWLQSHPTGGWIYKADDHQAIDADLKKNGYRWKPSIHMPKVAARIWLEVTDVKVERLHSISDEDIVAEGVRYRISEGHPCFILGEENSALHFMPEGFKLDGSGTKITEHDLLFAHWAELWCKINGRKSWDMNPWVWAISFKVLSTTGKLLSKKLSEIDGQRV